MSAGCPLLETVQLQSRYVSIEGFRRLAQRCVHLKEVTAGRNYPANDVRSLKTTFRLVRWNIESLADGEVEFDEANDHGNY